MVRARFSSTRFPLLLACIFVLLSGLPDCGGTPGLERADAGKSIAYTPGIPNLDIEAEVTVLDQRAVVDLFLNIPAASLTFTKVGVNFRARCEITARLLDRETRELKFEANWVESTNAETYEATQTFDPIALSRQFTVKPGEYVLEVTLEDLNAGKNTIRTQAVTVRDLTGRRPAIGKISLRSRRSDGSYRPVVAFHLAARPDSLWSGVNLYNLPADTTSFVQVLLVRYKGDTTAALPPYTYDSFSIMRSGQMLSFDRADTVRNFSSKLRPDSSRAMILGDVPASRPGLYRLSISVLVPSPSAGGTEPDTLLTANRILSIKDRNFPSPRSLDDLVAPLVYIATDRELSYLMSAGTFHEKQRRFDSLWLSFGENRLKAADLIRKYYGRVEAANRLFTTTKEGWKTDRGMLYIVLGPPIEIMDRYDVQTWYYDFRGGVMGNVYVFKRVIVAGDGISFDNYILERQPGYEGFWDWMTGKWRGGDVY